MGEGHKEEAEAGGEHKVFYEASNIHSYIQGGKKTMPEPQLLSIQPLPLPYSRTPRPHRPWPFIQPGSVCLSVTAAHGREGRGRQELRKELDMWGKKRSWGL